MKRVYFILMLVVLSLSSCNFTEEITFDEDGAGTFISRYDMATFFDQLKEKGMGESAGWGKGEKAVDSVIYFKDILNEAQDSISRLSLEEQKKLKALEDVVMNMRMDPEKGIFDMGFGLKFKSLEELPEVIKTIDDAKKVNSKNNPQYEKIGETASGKSLDNALKDVDFRYEGKKFSRIWKGNAKRSKEEAKKVKDEIAQMGDMKSLFEEMTYTLKYTFPRKIKSVSNKKAVISKDKKTVTLTLDFISIIEVPELLNLEVKLK